MNNVRNLGYSLDNFARITDAHLPKRGDRNDRIEELLSITKEIGALSARASYLAKGCGDQPINSASQVRRFIAARNARARYIEPQLTSDVPWNMLLDLYAAHLEGRAISLTSAYIASNAPNTTALRWVTALENEGLVFRESDGKDKRRVYLRLAPKAVEAIGAYLSHVAAETQLIVRQE